MGVISTDLVSVCLAAFVLIRTLAAKNYISLMVQSSFSWVIFKKSTLQVWTEDQQIYH